MKKIKKILNFKNHWLVIGWSVIFVAALTKLIGLNGLGMIKIILAMMTIHALSLIIVTIWSQLQQLQIQTSEDYARYLFNFLNVFLADLEMIVLLPTIVIIKNIFSKVTLENIFLSLLFFSLIAIIMKFSIYLAKMSNLFKFYQGKKAFFPVVLQLYTMGCYFLIFHIFYILN